MFRTIKNRWARELLSWVVVVGAAFAINILIRDHVFAITKIEGTSMMPTLENNQRVYLNRLAYSLDAPHRGDIIVFPAPNDTRDYIKRIIALPGDTVEIANGELIVNHQVEHETYIDAETDDFGPVTVPQDRVFVMGDNRHPFASMDSRDPRVGTIAIHTIKGRVECVLYPTPELL